MNVDRDFSSYSSERGFQPGTPAVLGVGLLAGVIVLMLGFVAMYQIAYGNRVYPGVRALGHDLGGYTREEAGSVLQRGLDDISRRQLIVGYAEHSWTFTAQELGLRTDIGPVLDSVFLVGREGHVLTRFWTQFGLLRQGRSFEQPSAAFDPNVQTALLQKLAKEIDRPTSDARLTVRGDFNVELEEAQNGRKLDVDASRRQVQEALSSGTNRVILTVQETQPRNAENNLARAREQAERILSGPIALNHGGRTWVLDRPQLASILRFDSRLDADRAAFLDRPAIETWTKTLAEAVAQEPQDARFSWSGGKLEVLRPSKDGVELDVKATVDFILAEAYGEHSPIELPVQVTRPAVPMDERHNLGIKQLIKSSKTSFAGSVPAKQANITLAAKRLNGAVVPPGGMFSFNKELGSTSLDAGWQIGWGISAGTGGNVKTVPSVAGGICQVATTLFHSVFWSGYPIEERNWHLYWIQAYTSEGRVGLDATVDEEAGLDFKFINPTKTHVLVQSWVDDSMSINFALYGTPPDWTVKVDPSEKTDVVPAEADQTVVEEEPTLPEGQRLAVERAMDGFVVTNIRRVIQNGEERTLRLVSRYRPSRNVILVGTGGKPPSGRTVVESNKPAQAPRTTPTASTTPSTPGASGTPQPAATPKATPAPTKAPAAPPAAPPVVAPTSPPPVPTVAPTPKPPAPTPVPPTATPRRR